MKLAVVLFLLLISLTEVYAQDTLPKSGKIILTGLKAKLDGKKLSGAELKHEIYKVPAAIQDYRKYKTNMALAYVSTAALLGSLFFYQGNNEDQKIVGPIISIAGGAGVLFFFFNGKSKLKKSIDKRNSLTY